MMKKYLIWIILALIIGFFGWQIYFPESPLSEEEVIFNVEKGEGSREIAFNLEREGIIKSAPFFRIYTVTTGISGKLQAGSYLLSPSMNIPQIAEKFSSGDTAKNKVTIPEGFTVKQIEEKLNIKIDPALEGFLFPDTYQFAYYATPEEIIKIMQDNFEKKMTEDLKGEIKNQNKTIFDIITMASLIEKEVKEKEEKELVSGILWKRLKAGIPLQVDATISYITGVQTTKISKTDTQIDSPYNTYKYRGLPLGPICNPGLESIKAAIYPENSEYLYYLSTPEGETIFSKTLEEHNIAKAKYLK